MATVAEMPKTAEKATRGHDNNVWTLVKRLRPGDTLEAGRHDISVVEVIEERDIYNLCRVRVEDACMEMTLPMGTKVPLGSAPKPLQFGGNFGREF